jgi:acyl-CoA synthetase (AMP-forming)/AMP-acid ligase II
LNIFKHFALITILTLIFFGNTAVGQTKQRDSLAESKGWCCLVPNTPTVTRQWVDPTRQAAQDYEPKLKVFAGFSQLYIAPDETSGGPTVLIARDRARLNGWNGSAEYRLAEFKEIYLGAVVDISGHYGQVTNSARFTNPPPFPAITLINSNDTRLHTFLAGPQLSRDFARDRVTVFGRGLVGTSRLSGNGNSVFYALAFGAGGGVDLNYGKFFVRPVQIDWLRTQHEYTNQLKTFQQGHAQQDSVRTAFGVGFSF